MTLSDIRREEEALDWVRRLADPDFTDWAAHAVWLEADPRNAEAFDQMSLEMEAATEGLAPGRLALPIPENDNAVAPAGRRRWPALAGLAVAAGFAGVMAVPHFRATTPALETFSTQPGVSRHIALADGTRVTLNGDSSLQVDPAAPRTATLVRGEGYFEVTHDPRAPFALRAGAGRIEDVGTAFDVALDGAAADVAVHEGAVRVGAARLKAGQATRIAADGRAGAVLATDTAGVGSWRNGRLSYRDASLARVTRDLSRNLGEPVALDPALAGRSFTGVLMLGGDHAAVVRRLADATGLRAARSGDGWRFSPGDR
jgi:transmembrane sensor